MTFKRELGESVQRHVVDRMAAAETPAQLLAAQKVGRDEMDAIAEQVRAESGDWLAYRVLSVDGVRVVHDWRSRRRFVIKHWRAVYACCRQEDPSLLARYAGVVVGRVVLETDPVKAMAADEHGLLRLPGSPEESAPWHPELER
jgi:hypothetical protein